MHLNNDAFYYSIPARCAGRRLAVRLSATTVEVLDATKIVAKHERAAGRYLEVLTLDHYLEVLKTKPGALPGATALAQAKACGAFTATHQAYWDAARKARGDAAGTRALIDVLLAHSTLPVDALITAMRKAIEVGVLDRQVVHPDARRQANGHVAPIIAIGALARYDRRQARRSAWGDQVDHGVEGADSGRDERPDARSRSSIA